MIPFLALGAAIFLAAASLSAAAALALVAATSTYFGVRKLALRMTQRAPKIDPVLLAGVAGVLANTWVRAPALPWVISAIFAARAIVDAARTVRHQQRTYRI